MFEVACLSSQQSRLIPSWLTKFCSAPYPTYQEQDNSVRMRDEAHVWESQLPAWLTEHASIPVATFANVRCAQRPQQYWFLESSVNGCFVHLWFLEKWWCWDSNSSSCFHTFVLGNKPSFAAQSESTPINNSEQSKVSYRAVYYWPKSQGLQCMRTHVPVHNNQVYHWCEVNGAICQRPRICTSHHWCAYLIIMNRNHNDVPYPFGSFSHTCMNHMNVVEALFGASWIFVTAGYRNSMVLAN